MKQSGIFIKAAAVLLAFCFLSAAVMPQNVFVTAAAENADNYDSLSAQEKQAVLEQKLKEVNSKLASLKKQSNQTEEYINTLNEKISYLKSELALSKQEIESSETKISNLEKQYEKNESEIESLKIEIKEVSEQSEKLQQQFDKTFEEYGERARALYISGNTTTLEMLLTCDDISSFLTRLEMIKRVSISDKELLSNLKSEGEQLSAVQADLQNKQDTLSANQQALVDTRASLKETIAVLESQQVTYTQKENAYEDERAESDALLLQLQTETQTYSEYRNQDQADLEAINEEIAAAAEKYLEKIESSTTTTTKKAETTTTAKASGSTTAKPSSTTSAATTKASGALSMTYPVPSQTKITTAYGSAGYVGHTGVDFACASGSAVVAAESGYVIISKDITSHSNCSCSYTGGGYHSYGRYIVIMHDKKNSSGNYVYTLYAHNSSRVVSQGQYVTKGQLIAYSGSTGNSTGPHCHFEVRTPDAQYEHCVNPTAYLP